MNGKQSGESQVPGNRVIKQLIRVELGKSSSAPMSTHLKGGDDLEPLSYSLTAMVITSHTIHLSTYMKVVGRSTYLPILTTTPTPTTTLTPTTTPTPTT